MESWDSVGEKYRTIKVKAVCVGPHSCHPNISLSGMKETLEVLQRKLQQANHRYNQLGEHTSSEEFK